MLHKYILLSSFGLLATLVPNTAYASDGDGDGDGIHHIDEDINNGIITDSEFKPDFSISQKYQSQLRTAVAELHVDAQIQSDASLTVRETYTFVRGQEKLPPLIRTIFPREAPNAFLLIREITDISVRGGAGAPLPFKTSSYGFERTQIVATLPEDAGNKITLSYTITRSTGETGDGYQTPLEIFPPSWSLPYHRLSLSITLPKGFDANQIAIENHYSSLYPLDSKWEHTGNTLTLRYTVPDPEDGPPWIKLNITFPGEGITPEESMFLVLFRQAQIALILFILVFVVAVILRLLHPSMSVRTTHLIHIAIGVTLVLTLVQSSFFWINGTSEPPLDQWYENGLMELGAFGGFIGLVCGYMWHQSQALREKRRDAWYGQLGVPLILTLLMGYSSVHPACYFFGLIGYAMLFYWFRSDLALFLGAGLHRLVEKVITEGETTVAALAKEFKLTEPDVVRVLKQTPELPIIADYQQGVVYSPSVAALKVEFVICKSCGGGMETGGMDLLQCGYCNHSYATTETQQTLESPTPVIVESVSHAIKGISIGLGLFAACSAALSLLGSVVLAIATWESGWLFECLAGVYIAIFVAAVAYWLSTRAKAIKTKKSNGLFVGLFVLAVFCIIPPPDTDLTTSLTDWLLLACFLVIPTMAFIGLQGPRTKIHYGAKPTALQDALKSQGEVSLSNCASLLKCNYEDAVRLIRYLCASGKIPAIYDRIGLRIVEQKKFSQLAQSGACIQCGGLLGVIGGQVKCHFCGNPPKSE